MEITKIYLGGIFMAKLPHTPEFRAKVSQEYLDGASYCIKKTATSRNSHSIK